VQKQMLGEVENWMVIWWQAESEIFVPKLSKSDNFFSSYSQKCCGCFFETQCICFLNSLQLTKSQEHYTHSKTRVQ